jgi:hypothetical protein
MLLPSVLENRLDKVPLTVSTVAQLLNAMPRHGKATAFNRFASGKNISNVIGMV